jgi:hypothetical protein
MTKKDTVQCPKCDKISELNSLKPVFKKEFSKADGTLVSCPQRSSEFPSSVSLTVPESLSSLVPFDVPVAYSILK